MATSGTTTFESGFLIDDVIQEAYDRVGVKAVSGYQLKSARRSLNIMFQEWANRGLHYWEIDKTNVDLIEGQAEYKFFRSSDDGTSAVTTPTNGIYGVDDILEAALRDNRTQTTQSDSALTKINRSTYSGLSNKLSKGSPSQYYVQRFTDHTMITVYPTPDTTAATKDLAIYFVKRIQDVGGYSNTADVPYRFVPCMTAGLSYYLSQKEKPEMVQQMKMLYEDELQRALTEDGSSSSTFITPQAYYPNV
jgi:hypothetical protein|tara:strand:+ start:836 stop:1582 length:747 start_codon:yes stop_codon:yes gene_type:complete